MNLRFLRVALWLTRSQWYTPRRLRAFQEERLRHLVRHAYTRCPYYRELFAAHGISQQDVQTVDDLEQVPVLTREAIMNQNSQIVAADAARFYPQPATTSGTTGAPMAFLRDRQAVNVGNAALWRFRRWHGIGLGSRIAEIRGFPFRTASGAIDHQRVSIYFPESRTLRLNLATAVPHRRAEIVQELVRFRPDAIQAGSPTLLSLLSLYLLERRRADRIQPRVVFVGGERLFPDQRNLIAEAFQAPVVEVYANWEYAIFGGECPEGRLHMASEMGIVEILVNGTCCEPGHAGEIIVTSLWNCSFPFLRYAIGDMAAVDSDPCRCGRSLPAWRILGGKEKDLLATREGYVFLPNAIIATPRWRGKVMGIRFYQETRNDVLVQVVKGPGFTPEDTAALHAELNDYLRGQLEIAFAFVDSLEQTPGGKYRMVVSKVPLVV